MKVIILAGGNGKRMNSDIPKVLHMLCGKPILNHVIDNVLEVFQDADIVVVVGKNRQIIAPYVSNYSNLVMIDQDPPMGTGDAVKQCLSVIKEHDEVLIVNGDTPFLKWNMLELCKVPMPAILVAKVMNPFGQGRIILDKQNVFVRIVEEKDASEQEKLIDLINAGVYFVSGKYLLDNIPKLTTDNAQNEYYLTDIFKFGGTNYHTIRGSISNDIMNINTQEDLKNAIIIYNSIHNTNFPVTGEMNVSATQQ